MMKGKVYKVGTGYNQLENADRVMAQGVLLPVHHGLTDAMFQRFQNVVARFISSKLARG